MQQAELRFQTQQSACAFAAFQEAGSCMGLSGTLFSPTPAFPDRGVPRLPGAYRISETYIALSDLVVVSQVNL